MRGRLARLFRLDSGSRLIILVACCEGLVLIIALVAVVALWLYLGNSF